MLPAEQHVSPQRLLGWINIPNLEFHDMEKIDERRQVWVPAEELADEGLNHGSGPHVTVHI